MPESASTEAASKDGRPVPEPGNDEAPLRWYSAFAPSDTPKCFSENGYLRAGVVLSGSVASFTAWDTGVTGERTGPVWKVKQSVESVRDGDGFVSNIALPCDMHYTIPKKNLREGSYGSGLLESARDKKDMIVDISGGEGKLTIGLRERQMTKQEEKPQKKRFWNFHKGKDDRFTR